MFHNRRLLFTCLGIAVGLGVTQPASAALQTSFRRAYTGSVGGNTHFGGGYSIEYGLSANKSDVTAVVGGDARLDAWVKVFNQQFNALSMRGSGIGAVIAGSSACISSVGYETYLLGIKVPDASGSGALSGGTYANKAIVNRTQRLTPKAQIDLVRVGPVVLGLEAWATATESVRLNGTVWCTRVSAQIRPGAVVSVVANWRIDAVIAAAGVRGTINLGDLSLPATLSASLTWNPETNFLVGGSFCSWQTSTSATAAVEVVPVSGRFEPYVRVGLECFDIFGLLPNGGICLSKEWSSVLWNGSVGKSVFPLTGQTPLYFIDFTSLCPVYPAAPPAR